MSTPEGREYCPICEPEPDPNNINVARFCNDHQPSTTGVHDRQVEYRYLSGTAEAGGEDNVKMCDLIHRDSPLRRGDGKKKG